MPGSPIDIEKTNLEAHVDLCAQRYESLDNRLSKIETSVVELQNSIKDNHNNMVNVIIGTAGTIVVGLLGVIGVVLTNS